MGNIFGRRRRCGCTNEQQRSGGFNLRLHHNQEKQQISQISKEETDAINRLVDQFLANELVNNKFIPDAVERKMYCNVVRMIVGLLKVSVDHASLEVLGHRFVISMTPVVAAAGAGEQGPPLQKNVETAMLSTPNGSGGE
jgi:hypothetical protein